MLAAWKSMCDSLSKLRRYTWCFHYLYDYLIQRKSVEQKNKNKWPPYSRDWWNLMLCSFSTFQQCVQPHHCRQWNCLCRIKKSQSMNWQIDNFYSVDRWKLDCCSFSTSPQYNPCSRHLLFGTVECTFNENIKTNWHLTTKTNGL